MKNLGHWLGLTLARGGPVCAETLPLSDIVITTSRKDLQFAVPFVAQIFMAAPSSLAFHLPFLALGSFCFCWLGFMHWQHNATLSIPEMYEDELREHKESD